MKSILTILLTLTLISAKGQLTVEGTASAKGFVTGKIYNQEGDIRHLLLKGQKNKWKWEFDYRNMSYRMEFRAGTVTRIIHVYTHQPDGIDDKHTMPVKIDFTKVIDHPETVIYWSPSRGSFVHLHKITREDTVRLEKYKLWPMQLGTDTIPQTFPSSGYRQEKPPVKL